jgi:branched-subunit amino acid ABC-type transport system permease component
VTQFLSLLLNGISLGAIYALIALGFVIIFKASEVVSFTQGSLLLLGAYTIARLSDPLGFWLAGLAGILVTALAALMVERLIINRLRGAPVISLAIVTIGVDIILLTELIRRIGSDILNVPTKGVWGMSWRQEATKGVEDCEKRGGAVNRALIPRSLNYPGGNPYRRGANGGN